MNFKPGHGVHPIQANKALGDRDSWRPADLVEIGDGFLEVGFDDGTTAHYRCARAGDLAGRLDGQRAPGELLRVIVIERWSVLMAPLGKDGHRQPGRIKPLRAFALEDGAVTTALVEESNSPYELRLYSIARGEERPAPPRRIRGDSPTARPRRKKTPVSRTP